MGAMGMPVAVYLPRFYTEGMGLSLVTVGTIFTLARIWDVITDQVMPAMDGLTLIRALRSLSAYADTPILMLTTEADGTIREQARAAGATGFLPKPFDPDGLTDSVMQLFEWHAQTHGSASTH